MGVYDLPVLSSNDRIDLINRDRRRRRRHSHSSDSDTSDVEPFDPSVFDGPYRRFPRPIPRISHIPAPISSPPSITTAQPPLKMSSKIIPAFSGPLTANGLKIWIGQCEDGFENYQDTHKDNTLAPKTRIRFTGSALLEPTMAEWWAAGRKEYLELATWDAFIAKLKERFLPVGWKMDALERFYGCEQGKRDFRIFAAELAQCHGALPSNTISNAVYKYHLLFHAHPQLYLRMRAMQSFDIDSTSMTVDQLTALMGHQWDSLVADLAPRSSRVAASSTASVPLRTSGVISSTGAQARLPPAVHSLTDAERKTLSDANGCFNCRRKPGDPDWTPHFRRNCPGNPSISAPPGPEYTPPVMIAAAAFANLEVRDVDTSEEEVEDELWGESDDDENETV